MINVIEYIYYFLKREFYVMTDNTFHITLYGGYKCGEELKMSRGGVTIEILWVEDNDKYLVRYV